MSNAQEVFKELFTDLPSMEAGSSGAYEEQCVKEFVRILGKSSLYRRQIYEMKEDRGFFSFADINHAFPITAVDFVAGEPSQIKERSVAVADVLKLKHPKILKLYHKAAMAVDLSKPPAVFIRTRDFGNVVLHTFSPDEESPYLFVPYGEDQIYIEARAAFLRRIAAYFD